MKKEQLDRLWVRITVRWDKPTRMWVVRSKLLGVRTLGSSYKFLAVALGRGHAHASKPSRLIIFSKRGSIQARHTYRPRRTVG